MTFSVTSIGVLAITAPTTLVDLGSGAPAVVSGTTTAPIGTANNFGAVTVTDDRGLNPATWTATVSSTDFTNQTTSADVIPVGDATYLTGAVAATPTCNGSSITVNCQPTGAGAPPVLTSGAGSVNVDTPLTLSGTPQSVVTEPDFDGDNSTHMEPGDQRSRPGQRQSLASMTAGSRIPLADVPGGSCAGFPAHSWWWPRCRPRPPLRRPAGKHPQSAQERENWSASHRPRQEDYRVSVTIPGPSGPRATACPDIPRQGSCAGFSARSCWRPRCSRWPPPRSPQRSPDPPRR